MLAAHPLDRCLAIRLPGEPESLLSRENRDSAAWLPDPEIGKAGTRPALDRMFLTGRDGACLAELRRLGWMLNLPFSACMNEWNGIPSGSPSPRSSPGGRRGGRKRWQGRTRGCLDNHCLDSSSLSLARIPPRIRRSMPCCKKPTAWGARWNRGRRWRCCRGSSPAAATTW